MTISDLIAQLSSYPMDTRVALLDSNKHWLLPIEVKMLFADSTTCGVDLIAITADDMSDEIEGLARENHHSGPGHAGALFTGRRSADLAASTTSPSA